MQALNNHNYIGGHLITNLGLWAVKVASSPKKGEFYKEENEVEEMRIAVDLMRDAEAEVDGNRESEEIDDFASDASTVPTAAANPGVAKANREMKRAVEGLLACAQLQRDDGDDMSLRMLCDVNGPAGTSVDTDEAVDMDEGEMDTGNGAVDVTCTQSWDEAWSAFQLVNDYEAVGVAKKLSFTRWTSIGKAAQQFFDGFPVHIGVLARAAKGNKSQVVTVESQEHLLPAGAPDDQAAGMLAALRTREAFAHAAIVGDIMEVLDPMTIAMQKWTGDYQYVIPSCLCAAPFFFKWAMVWGTVCHCLGDKCIGLGVKHIGLGDEHIGLGVKHVGLGVEHVGLGVKHIGFGVKHIGMVWSAGCKTRLESRTNT